MNSSTVSTVDWYFRVHKDIVVCFEPCAKDCVNDRVSVNMMMLTPTVLVAVARVPFGCKRKVPFYDSILGK